MTVYFVVKPMSLSCFASLREILSFAIRSSMLDVRRSLVCFEPVLAGADGDFEGAVEWEGFGHAFCEDLSEAVFFSGGGFEEEFIVYLKEHAALQFLFP